MKTLEIRRHAQRTKPGQNLSQRGINLARLTAPKSGTFDMLATANIPRAVQTAIAFCHEVTHIEKALGHLPGKIFDKCAWPGSFAQMSSAIKNHKTVAQFAQSQAKLWRQITNRIPQSGSALIISHGAIIELGMLASLPNAGHTEWGAAIGYCEGIRLSFEDGAVTGEIIRVPKEHYEIEN